MKELIAEAIDIVVFLERVAKIGPVVKEILIVKGFENGKYVCEVVEQHHITKQNL